MLIVELIVVLLAASLGTRLEGIGIGFADGLGVLVLAAIGVKPGSISFDAISIVMAIIAAISVMQVVGGLDYLVHQTEKLLCHNPRHITILTPIVTYLLTTLASTGNISLAILLVITEVAKEQDVKPCHPLSIAVVPVQIATTASPTSAVAVRMFPIMEGYDINYSHLLPVVILSTLLAVLVMSFLVTMLSNPKLSDDPTHHKRLEEGLVELRSEKQIEVKSGVKTSVWLFLLGVVGVAIYATISSPNMDLVEKPLMNTTSAILVIVFSVATLTTVICKVDTDNILNSSTFKADMGTCIYILGVVWLDDTFVSNNINWIKDIVSEMIQGYPQLLTVIFFSASVLLCSQAATVKALIPMTLTLNVSPLTVVASFAVVPGLFIPSIYSTLAAAVQMDDMDIIHINKFVFNHPFFIPGTLGVALAVCFGLVPGSPIP